MPQPRSHRRALPPSSRRHRLSKAHTLRLRTWARQWARVRTRDGHILVRDLSRSSRNMLIDRRRRWRCLFEAILLQSRRGVMYTDGRRLQGEGFRLRGGLVFRCELLHGGRAVLGHGMRVLLWRGGKGRRARPLETGGVGRRLAAELGEVEI